jgi:hypothetical protein
LVIRKCVTLEREPMDKLEILYPENPQDGLTAQEAAEYLGTSAAMIRRYCREGVVQFLKVKEPDKAEPIYLIPMGELHKLAFRRRKGQTRKRYVLSTGKVAYGPSLPASRLSEPTR